MEKKITITSEDFIASQSVLGYLGKSGWEEKEVKIAWPL